MQVEKSLGIGCFHFGIRKSPSFQFKGSNYINELRTSLSRIPNLDNLKVEYDQEFEGFVDQIDEDLSNLHKDVGFYPYVPDLNIEFELYIPFRIQAELCGTEERLLHTYTEKFKVKLFQSYYFPVSIVESINPTKDNKPSTGIQVVREFLERKFSIEKSPFLRFEYIGPSPFHLECYVYPKKKALDEFWLLETEEFIESGYDKLIFYYNSDEIKSSDEALSYIIYSIDDEFGFYYKYTQLKYDKMFLWSAIQNTLNEIQQVQNTKGFKGFIRNIYERSSLLGKLFTDLATFEARNIYIDSIFKNEYSELYKAKDELYFKTFIDLKLDEKYDYPVKQVTELVKFYELRRVKNIELIFAVIAATIGGAVGALLTIYLKA